MRLNIYIKIQKIVRKKLKKEDPETFKKAKRGEISYVDIQKQKKEPHVAHNAGDNEWYTPKKYIDIATKIMGKIDLDPASTSEANKIVKADLFYTEQENGLKQIWKGKIWMNPPYASNLIGKFIDKLVESVLSEMVTEAMVLVNNATDTKWFANLAKISSFLCFPTGRVKFWHPNKESIPLQGQCIAYIGNNESFYKECTELGIVVKVIHND